MQSAWSYLDEARRRQGKWMDELGFGPRTTASRVVAMRSTVRLLAYPHPNAAGPPLLLVPAPIKAAYIWDLDQEVSVVRHCLADGFQVYLLVWPRPRPGDEPMGLADYADRLIVECVNAIAAETERPKLFLAGHSLGGTLAAIFASLHPERVSGLIALEGPMHFSTASGVLERAAATVPSAASVTRWLGNVPGSFLDVASECADPLTFLWEPTLDRLRSAASERASRTHWRVQRWALDEMPLPQRLFQEVVDGLYRQNDFARGRLIVGDRCADPKALRVPILAVADPRSRIVPLPSIEAYGTHTRSRDVQVLLYAGDVGVTLQHVGILVGHRAHTHLWPRVFRWMHERASASS